MPNLSIRDWLGESVLLDDKEGAWPEKSELFDLMRRYCSKETLLRAERLVGTERFGPEISRKIHGALILREAYEGSRGRSEAEVYSGATLAIRCGDANPRRLIRIFNGLRLADSRQMAAGSGPHLPPKEQTRVLRRLSTSALVRVQSEPQCGKELYEFLCSLGDFMNRAFHEVPLATDQVTSIRVDRAVPEEVWKWIRRAVELGLLYPNLGPQQRDEMPYREGTFHFAFILAPHFFLLPRRGHSRSLSTILSNKSSANQLDLL